MSTPSDASEPESRDSLEEVVDSFIARRRRGETPAIGEFAERLGGDVERARRVLELLVELEEVGEAAPISKPASAARLGEDVPHEIGDYRIVRELGRGGMGVVYEADDLALGRRVALKVLPYQGGLDPQRLERFRREGRAVARLRHPRIVPIFSVGHANGLHYYAMQLVPGRGLDEVLHQVRRVRGARGMKAQAETVGRGTEAASSAQASRASAASASSASSSGESSDLLVEPDHREKYCRRVARLGLHVAEALEHAHSQGILHRDVKPSNILVDAAGDVWLTDFGLAKDDASEAITESGAVLGTLAYLAPETLDGWADPRSDIYSLGVTLYELLALRPAFQESDRRRLIARIATEEPFALRRIDPSIPRDLETIVATAIEKEPALRYPSTERMADDLRAFLEDRPITARPSTSTERAIRWCRRNPGLASSLVFSLVLALLAMIGGGAAYFFKVAAEDSRRAADEADFWKFRAQSRSSLASRRPGQRERALAALVESRGRLPAIDTDRSELARHIRGMRDDLVAAEMRLDARELAAWRGVEVSRPGLFDFDSDGRRFVTGMGSHDLAVHHTDDPDSTLVLTMPDMRRRPGYVVFSATGRFLAVAHGGRVLSIRDLENAGREIWRRRVRHFERFVFEARDRAAAFLLHPDEVVLVDLLKGEDRTLRIEARRASALAFDPSGGWLAVGIDRAVALVDTETARETRRLDCDHEIDSIAWGPDGRRIAASGPSGTVEFLDTASGRRDLVLSGDGIATTGLAFDRSGRLLARRGNDNLVYLWDTHTGRLEIVLRGRSSRSRMRFVGEGLLVQSADPAGRSGTFRPPLLQEVTRGALTSTVILPDRFVTDLAVSADGQVLATAHYDRVRFWRLPGGAAMGSVELDDGADGVRWLADDSALLLWGRGGVELWQVTRRVDGIVVDADTMRTLADRPVAAATATPDGRIVVWGALARLNVLDLESGSRKSGRVRKPPLAGLPVRPRALAISSDGRHLVFGRSPAALVSLDRAPDDDGEWPHVRELTSDTRDFATAELSPDGDRIILARLDSYRILVNAVPLAAPRIISRDFKGPVLGSPPFDGEYVAPLACDHALTLAAVTLRSARTVTLLDPRDGTEFVSLEARLPQPIRKLRLDRHGRVLVAATKKKSKGIPP